jgi:hypothetical protein
MKKRKYKRVCLVNLSTGAIAVLDTEYIHTLSDDAILDSLYEVGKNVWIGTELFKVYTDYRGFPIYLRYEVSTIIERG